MSILTLEPALFQSLLELTLAFVADKVSPYAIILSNNAMASLGWSIHPQNAGAFSSQFGTQSAGGQIRNQGSEVRSLVPHPNDSDRH